MINKELFKQAFILLIIIGILDLAGNILYLHWTLWWFDTVLHILGGFCVSLATLSFLSSGTENNKLKIIILAIFVVFVVGILWEIFELYFGLTFLSDGIYYWMDTTSDILANTCGAFFSALYSFKILSKSE